MGALRGRGSTTTPTNFDKSSIAVPSVTMLQYGSFRRGSRRPAGAASAPRRAPQPAEERACTRNTRVVLAASAVLAALACLAVLSACAWEVLPRSAPATVDRAVPSNIIDRGRVAEKQGGNIGYDHASQDRSGEMAPGFNSNGVGSLGGRACWCWWMCCWSRCWC